MALRTKLNIGENEKNGLDDVDDLDAVYIKGLEKSGLSEDIFTQFQELTKQLETHKKDRKESN